MIINRRAISSEFHIKIECFCQKKCFDEQFLMFLWQTSLSICSFLHIFNTHNKVGNKVVGLL